MLVYLTVITLSYIIVTLLILYHKSKIMIWEVSSLILLLSAVYYCGLWLGIVFGVNLILVELLLRSVTLRGLIGKLIYTRAHKVIPKLSKTEQETLNIGDSWFEKAIFIGQVDWHALTTTSNTLTIAEQEFLNNETDALCALLDEWSITQNANLPDAVWNYLNAKGFFGLVISSQYGGKGFSALAHSEIITKIASRSIAAAVTVMVPNSLGPGELLEAFGTSAQKDYYLPRLAAGLDIPCFALTEPTAGSDATSIQSDAIVVRHEINGCVTTGLMITLNKRWITLAPIATLIGVAVNLKDPDNILQGEGTAGITCVLLSRDTENLEIGTRHLPMHQAFMNGPVRGANIFVPIANIIGGQKNAGRGWQMLVECLSVGRAISLPALANAAATLAYLTTGAFARMRRQFNTAIIQFEGIQEKLAQIAGWSYLINATRLLTIAAVTKNHKPAVASAIAKHYTTELARKIVNNAMDIHAGKAIVLGPSNYLANQYSSLPIMITVEGANIMTRNLLIFSQVAMLCHPFIRPEVEALLDQDTTKFNHLIWQHVYYFAHGLAKAICSAFSGGIFLSVPKDDALTRERQRLTRLIYAFSWLADLTLIVLGKKLKRKEFLAARLADGLSNIYMALAAIRFYQQHASTDGLHAKWSIAYCCYQAQRSMLECCSNFPRKWLGYCAKFLIFPYGQTMKYPNDRVTSNLAQFMGGNNSYRNILKKLIYLNLDQPQALENLEDALQLTITYGDLYKKIANLHYYSIDDLQIALLEKIKLKELTQEEMQLLLTIERKRLAVMQVDEFHMDNGTVL